MLKASAILGFGVMHNPGFGRSINSIEGNEKLIFSEVLKSAPWPERYGLGVVVFQDRLWVLGGTDTPESGAQLNDIWSSDDGLHWRQELANAPWRPRWNHAVFAFKGKIWVIGGLASVNPDINLNDIWSSSDGKVWTLEVAEAPWVGRHVWSWMTHRDRMYLIGGATDGSTYYQDVISSEDGVHWRSEVILRSWFSARKNFAAASYEGRIFLAAGKDLDPLNDVWSSETGETWDCLLNAAPWSSRTGALFIVYNGKLWLMGGEAPALVKNKIPGPLLTDLWTTTNGKDWKKETDQAGWPVRYVLPTGMIVFRNKVWLLGGSRQSRGKGVNDIWTFEEAR